MSQLDSMRQDWDDRARKDAFHFIASWRSDWDEASFFASGEEDYARLVRPALERLSFDPAGKSMLELGCGAGRMTRCFATHFSSVCAFDVSAEMQKRGREYLSGFSNIRWVLGDGASVSGVDSSSVDFVFSYLVLQHMPAEPLAFALVAEMMRVLRPGGAFLFQFNGEMRSSMNWKGRVAWGCVDLLWSSGLRSASRAAARALGGEELAGKSWRGVSLTPVKIEAVVRAAGGSILQVSGGGTPMTWCSGRVSSRSHS
jgi:ubiquinone/menaquinone biosynthesis C-methylase UbiE